jgi:hypothetical protein
MRWFVCNETTLCLICGNYFCCKMEYYYKKSGKCSKHVNKCGLSKFKYIRLLWNRNVVVCIINPWVEYNEIWSYSQQH